MLRDYAWGGMLGDTRKQAAEAYFMYVEDANADARSKDPKLNFSSSLRMGPNIKFYAWCSF